MRILNLYAGIGGNRARWTGHEVVAVEYDPLVAAAYGRLHPDDTVMVEDAHAYLLAHHAEFDFIWSSPPCQSHTRYQNLRVRGYGDAPKFPDGRLFEEVLFMSNWSTTPYVIENVVPYYAQWIPGWQKVDRHLYWASFTIPAIESVPEALRSSQIAELQQIHGIDLTGINLPDKRQALRNCVPPRVGQHILNAFLESRRIELETA